MRVVFFGVTFLVLSGVALFLIGIYGPWEFNILTVIFLCVAVVSLCVVGFGIRENLLKKKTNG